MLTLSNELLTLTTRVNNLNLAKENQSFKKYQLCNSKQKERSKVTQRLTNISKF